MAIPTITVEQTRALYSDEAMQDRFISGWMAAGGYTDDCCDGNSNPWCCPWYWAGMPLPVTGTTPEEWGASWWEQCRPEIEARLGEEAKARAAAEDDEDPQHISNGPRPC